MSTSSLERPLLVAYDFSEGADVAVDVAFTDVLATRGGGHIILLNVIQPMHPPILVGNSLLRAGIAEIERETMVEVARRLERVAEAVRKRHREATAPPPLEVEAAVRYGVPSEVIVDLAKERGAERIYVGANQKGDVTRLLLGSVALRVVRTSPVSVVVAHARERVPEVA